VLGRRGAVSVRRHATALLLVAAVAGAAWTGARSAWTAFALDPASRLGSDFQILHTAGRALVEGLDVHDPAVMDEVGRRSGRPSTPFCAALPLTMRLFATFASTELPRAYTTWLTLHALAIVAAGVLLAGGLRVTGLAAVPSAALAVALIGFDDATWMSLAMNSTNGVALLAVVAALRAGLAGRPWLEGALLAVAAVAKTSPALLVVVALLARRGRVVLGALGTGAALAVFSLAWVGWPVHESWIERVLPALGYAPELESGWFSNTLHAWNLSPNGVIARELAERGGAAATARGLAWLVAALVLVQLAVGVRRGGPASGADREGSDGEGAEAGPGVAAELWRQYGLGLSASFLVSSVTWPHHLILATVPAAALVVALRTAGGRAPAVAGLLACAVLFLPLGAFGADDAQRVDVAAKALACAVLFLALVVRPRAWTSPAGGPSHVSGRTDAGSMGAAPRPGDGPP